MATRIAVAMSGGVDSTLGACLLKQEGHDVIGVHMILGQHAVDDSAREAEHAAQTIGAPLRVMDYRRDFQPIVDYFCNSYNRGLTPNPCVRCNPQVKFNKLCQFADEVGAEQVATGHYARVARRGERLAIQRGLDASKDQSYVLHRLTQEQLGRIVFPLGDRHKTDVRALAKQLGLDVAHKPGSQEVCFAPGRDHTELLRAMCKDAIRPGPILDTAGRVVGEHPGIQFFTIGQRRGLGVALGSPRYVVEIDPERNAVTIGTAEEALGDDAQVANAVWQAIPGLDKPRRALVQIRYNHTAVPAVLDPLGEGRVHVQFDEPQSAVTPGQAAVFYEGDVVLGGGWIERQ